MAKTILAVFMLALLLCSCGGGSSSHPVTLVRINITPTTASIAPGTTTQFTATGIFSDGTSADVTAGVTWSSSTPAVGTVSDTSGSRGLASAVSLGSTSITATSGSVSSSPATLNVAPLQSITVSPAAPGVVLGGTTQRFTAAGQLGNGVIQDLTNFVTWSTSNPAIATITPSGQASFAGAGIGTVTATLGGITNTVPVSFTVVTVQSLTVTPANPTLDSGATQTFTATGNLSDGSTRDISSLVNWLTTSPSVVSVTPAGLATARLPGTATVGASFPNVPTGSTPVTVLGPTSITLSPLNPTIAAGGSLQFSATGSFADGSTRDLTNIVTWSSSLNGVTITNASGAQPGAQGLATAGANAIGTGLISASLGNLAPVSTSLTVKALISLVVAPANPSLAPGGTVQLSATGTFSDGSTQDVTNSATWTSNFSSIATVSNTAGTKGLVTGVSLGTTTITAALAGGTGSTTVNVVSTPPTPPANRAYVTNFVGNTVSVIDTLNNVPLLPAITVGGGPRGIDLNPSTSRAYVANNDGTLSIIDLTTNSLITNLPLGGGGGSWGVAVNPGANRVYVTNSFGGKLSIVDSASNSVVTNVVVGAGPRGVVYNPTNNRIYVANFGDNTVSVVNAANPGLAPTVISLAIAPQDLVLVPGTNFIFVSSSFSNVVSVIDTTTNAVTTLPVGTVHNGIAASASRIYLSNNAGTVSVLNSGTRAEITASPVVVGADPQGIAVRSSTSRVYVVNNGSNNVSVINTAGDADTVVATIPVGSGPTDIAVLP